MQAFSNQPSVDAPFAADAAAAALLERLGEFPAHTPRTPGALLPLSGIRVLDFSHFIAGPLATMVLADMGADVIKVESLQGDAFRNYPPAHPSDAGIGAPYIWCNRNKRSIALDLKSDPGKKIALELVPLCDVVVQNFSTGVMERLGLGYEACKAQNPKLIYASVSAYGREGAFADRLGFDPVVQAESGFISMNGYPDRPGVRALSPVMDISTALTASNAILGALMARERHGIGQQLEVALYDTGLMMTGYASLQHLFSGREPNRGGNRSPDSSPSGVFKAADRHFLINCGNSGIFKRLMAQVLERPDLADDPRYATPKGRLERGQELFAILDEAFATQPWSFWEPRLRRASVPAGPVRTLREALRSEASKERNLVTRISHPQHGWLPNISSPIRYSVTPVADPIAAPAVGEHSAQILHEVLGYAEWDIAELISSGTVVGPRQTS